MIICVLGSVAQLVEHRPVAARVIGSTPFCSVFNFLLPMTTNGKTINKENILFLASVLILLLFLNFMCTHVYEQYLIYKASLLQHSNLIEQSYTLRNNISIVETTLCELKDKYSLIIQEKDTYYSNYSIRDVNNLKSSILNLVIILLAVLTLIGIFAFYYQAYITFNIELDTLKELISELKYLISKSEQMFYKLEPFLTQFSYVEQARLNYFWSMLSNLRLLLDNMVIDSTFHFGQASAYPKELYLMLSYLKNFILFVLIPCLRAFLDSII